MTLKNVENELILHNNERIFERVVLHLVKTFSVAQTDT